MSILLDAIKVTRSLLNDDDGLTWGDQLIIPKVQQAWKEILAKFQLNGIPVVREETSPPIAVAAFTSAPWGTTVLTAPTDLQTPTSMQEFGVNETQDNAIEMTQQAFIPNYILSDTIRYWSWIGQQIVMLGCMQPRQVLLYYIKTLASPTHLNDPLAINQSELYIGPRTAAIIYASLGEVDKMQTCDAMAQSGMSMIVRAAVKQQQSLPVRRRPFSYAVRRRNRFYI